MPLVHGVPVVVPPPKGYVVDFAHPRRNADLSSYIVAGVGIVISTFFMLQRLYVKTVVRRTFGYDDVLLIIAWLGAIAIQALIISPDSFKTRIMGIHAFEIPLNTFEHFVLIGGYVTSIVYAVPTTLSKVVILLFYKEINNPARWYQWGVRVLLFIVVGAGIGILFSSMFPCRPFARAYDLALANEGSCIDLRAMYQATAGIGVATDVLIASFPIPMIVGLRMSASKKAGIIITFAIGSATVITSIVRLVLLVRSLGSTDETWGGGPICLWICIEANLLICCASLSTIRQFFRAVAPRLQSIMGTSTARHNKESPLGHHELHEVGTHGSRTRAYYSRFDSKDSGINTIVKVQGSQTREQGKGEDGASVYEYEINPPDQAIVRTKITDVYYD